MRPRGRLKKLSLNKKTVLGTFYCFRHAIRVGELFPSVRELAKEVAVNPNTVARAYRELQSDGLLDSVRGKGMQVTPKALNKCKAARLKLIQYRLRDVLTEANRSGLTPTELHDLTTEELGRLKTKAKS